MGKQTKIRGASVRALLIFRRMQKIEKEAVERATVEIKNLLQGLIKKKKLDAETYEVLTKVYLNKKSETLEDKTKQIIESFKSELRANKNDGINTILLTLSTDGDLYKKPKEKYCYPLKRVGRRIDIIRFLIAQKNFVSGEDIAEAIGTSYGSTTFAIQRINAISRHRLDLPKGKANDLIISRDRGGYKLNPLYPITQEEL